MIMERRHTADQFKEYCLQEWQENKKGRQQITSLLPVSLQEPSQHNMIRRPVLLRERKSIYVEMTVLKVAQKLHGV